MAASQPSPAQAAQHRGRPHRRNADWPQAQNLPQTQSLAGRFWRRSVLGGIFCLWVCGLLVFTGLYTATVVAVVRACVTLGSEPPPPFIVAFATFIAAYEAYRWLAPPLPWSWLRHAVRNKFCYYPYFRFNTCVFEDELRPMPPSKRPGLDQQGEQDEPDHEPAAGAAARNLSYTFTPALKADERAMYAFHPHGILTCGATVNGAHHLRFAETDARWLVAENLFWFPGLRDMLKWLDFDNVNKRTFVALMERGQNLGFVPGGFEEATLFERGKHRVFLKKRFGFIKLALQYGYKIYPAYTFGEELTFHTFPYLLTLRLKLNEYKIPGAAFVGSLWCFFMPRSDVDLITVVGTPLQLPTIRDPTPADIHEHHAMYVRKVQALFDKFKGEFAMDPDAELEIF
ncbi:hypothetical protein PybrP1_000911 [[Pythium] brassicae (nom. inval.)]|nr:hypothetical protein PybrP1_000911 [[Pythium] brassicae (nom. inval.)]